MNNPADAKAMRRALLPRWIRFFSWLFLLFLATPVALPILAIVAPDSATFAAFGLSYVGPPLAPPALLISGILFFMGVSAFGLLWGKPWGVQAGLAAGAIGLVLCGFTMLVNGFETFRLEPLLQIPFLIELIRIRQPWREASGQEESSAKLSVVIGAVGGITVIAVVYMVLPSGERSSQNDDFVNTGPYVAPTVKDGRFYATRAYAKGRGEYPIEFSIDIPTDWHVGDVGPEPSQNLVTFVQRSESGKEQKVLGVGTIQHNEPYNRDVDTNEQLMAALMAQLTSQLEEQFDEAGLNPKITTRGWNKRGDRYEYRVDIKLDAWPGDDSAESTLTYVSILARPRLDHKPHGVLLILISREDETIHSSDDLLTKGDLARLLASFRFEN